MLPTGHLRQDIRRQTGGGADESGWPPQYTVAQAPAIVKSGHGKMRAHRRRVCAAGSRAIGSLPGNGHYRVRGKDGAAAFRANGRRFAAL
jgi:hypothetical protein